MGHLINVDQDIARLCSIFIVVDNVWCDVSEHFQVFSRLYEFSFAYPKLNIEKEKFIGVHRKVCNYENIPVLQIENFIRVLIIF